MGERREKSTAALAVRVLQRWRAGRSGGIGEAPGGECAAATWQRLCGVLASRRDPHRRPGAGPYPTPDTTPVYAAGAGAAKGRGAAPHREAEGGADREHQRENRVDDLVRLRLERKQLRRRLNDRSGVEHGRVDEHGGRRRAGGHGRLHRADAHGRLEAGNRRHAGSHNEQRESELHGSDAGIGIPGRGRGVNCGTR